MVNYYIGYSRMTYWVWTSSCDARTLFTLLSQVIFGFRTPPDSVFSIY